MFSKLKGMLLVIVGCCFLSGCATTNLFVTYNRDYQTTRAALNQGQFSTAIKDYQSNNEYQSPQLKYAELGRLEQLSGHYKLSLADYAKAIELVQQQQLAPKIQVSRILANAGALLSNNATIPYLLKGYEVVYLYQYQALNYLALGDVQDALVSTRRAGQAQSLIRTRHQEAIIKAKKSAQEKNIKAFNAENYKDQLASTLEAASKVRNGYENAFSYYLSAMLYEASGDDNDAYVSLQNALKVVPNNKMIQQALLQILEQRGGSGPQIKAYLKQFNLKHVPTIATHSGQLVVVLGQGLIAPIKSVSLAIPLPINNGLQIQMVSFPAYTNTYMEPIRAHIAIDGQIHAMAIITDSQALAARTLEDNYPLIYTHLVLRLIAKAVLTHEAQKDFGLIGNLAAQLWGAATSHADTRSWLSLPHDMQIYQIHLAPGKHDVAIDGKQATVLIKPNHISLVWIDHLSDFTHLKVMTL